LKVEWREEPIDSHHSRDAFLCGEPALDEYLRKYARQNHISGGAKTFVAISPAAPAVILGFYSISPGSLEFAKVPGALTKRLGRYDVPVFRLARLAVATSMQGKGLGGDLLLSAGARVLKVATEVGGVALAIDAKDARAAIWYGRFGAVPSLDDPLKLVLPLQTLAEVLGDSRQAQR
jgi:GNAT superfamily N-acetyltransferase